MNVLRIFGAEAAPSVHVAPAEVFRVGDIVVTNSILYGWICAVVIVLLLAWVARRITVKPRGGIFQFVEIGVDFITNLVVDSFDDKKVGRKYVPFFVTLFFFILLNNWLGLLPFVGEGLKAGENPLFRPFTADFNATFAMGALTMLLVYTASIKESGGLLAFTRHFFVGSPKNPLFFSIGVLEMFTDLTRVVSLSLRLFLNITIGEILITVFAYLGGVAAPVSALPFFLLELLVAALQAYIFVILGVMYLAIAVNHHTAHAKEEGLTGVQDSDRIEAKANGNA
jgi:F-type H+-transporting ATPase subunit a